MTDKKTYDAIHNELIDHPIYYYEIGAAKGGKRFLQIGEYISFHGFEPNEKEAKQLKQKLEQTTAYKEIAIEPCALMGKTNRIKINILSKNTCSSALVPNFEVISQFSSRRGPYVKWPTFFEQVGEYECYATTIDTYARANALPYIDFINLDTQGTELEILQGGEKIIRDSLLLLHVEMETISLYKDQPLINEVMNYLYNLGFRLICVENPQSISRKPATGYDKIDKGELVSIDGYFCRDPNRKFYATLGKDPARILRYMVLLYELGFKTFAVDIGKRYIEFNSNDKKIKELAEILAKRYLNENLKQRPIKERLQGIFRNHAPVGLKQFLKHKLGLDKFAVK